MLAVDRPPAPLMRHPFRLSDANQLLDRLSTAPPPAPHRGLGERKLV